MGWLFPSRTFDADQRYRREPGTGRIGSNVNRFVAIHLLAGLAFSTGSVGESYLFLGLAVLLFLLSLGMAIWLAWSVLRNVMTLRWYWVLVGLIPWGVICGETTAALLYLLL